jgi:BASS family bile acid:Na+ symporter
LIQPNANAGPALAAVAIAFNNDPEILGAMIAIIFIGIVTTGVVGAWLGKDDEEADQETSGSSAEMTEGTTNG